VYFKLKSRSYCGIRKYIPNGSLRVKQNSGNMKHTDTHETNNDVNLLIANFRNIINNHAEVHHLFENVDVLVGTES
jgi:hypothetical protein